MASIYLTRANPNIRNPYIQNAKGDSWFRMAEGVAAGYGLMVRSLKATNGKAKPWGRDGSLIPVSIVFLPSALDVDDPTKYEKSLGYLFLEKDENLEDVLAFISINQKNWIP